MEQIGQDSENLDSDRSLSEPELGTASCRDHRQTPLEETSSSAVQIPSKPKSQSESALQDTSTPSPASASAETLPQVDARGNYLRTSHRRWIVVDPDPAGLNCRWSDAVPDEWYSPAAQYPPMNLNAWPVVQQFPANTEFLANITPAGFAIMYYKNENPWLKVSLDEQDEICLVRAHSDYVKPVR